LSFTLVPKYGEATEVNVWNWRPTLELIRSAELIDEENYERMSGNDGDGQVDAQTAWKIADLIDLTLSKMKPGDRLLRDLSITDKPERAIVFKTPEDIAEG
jgi:hypothetical protein